ncbi:hypothetical protein [Thalassoroseus pseudoceratinae]|uniref:hypothetical protein n=1 Tax=Thalassoroseus pseudoceratinae TaxID=2713176 RepID=UPI0014205838|nr:hypothetical protein [Thalassoroseus pseudoceratinae]
MSSFTCKHTGTIAESLDDTRRILDNLAGKRDERQDGFASDVARSMNETVGDTAEDAIKFLSKHGIPRRRIMATMKHVGNEKKSPSRSGLSLMPSQP